MSTQLLSQLPPSVVDHIVDVGRPLLETDEVVVRGSVIALVVAVIVAVDVMIAAVADAVLDVMGKPLLMVVALVPVVVVPVPAPTPIQPERPALHDENDAISGPTNQSSPNCPLYGLRYEEALEGKCSMPEIAIMGLGFVGPALLTILISAHWT
jgi:hypothetical protein